MFSLHWRMKVRSLCGSEPLNGSGLWSFGLDVNVLDLMRLLMALANELASGSSCIIVSVSSLSGSGGIELGCTEGCAKDMSAEGCAENGNATCLTGVAGPDGLRSVNSS